jgi:hypothetical protein
MNRNQSDQYNRNEDFHTRRSERYRHPESSSNYRFDDYGASARGGYGNEGYGGTWGNQGNEMGGSRNFSASDRSGRQSSSRAHNADRGYGSRERDYSPQNTQRSKTLYHYESGKGYGPGSSSAHRSYGYHSDYDSHGTGYRHDSNPEDLYGSEVSRRFQGSDQGRYQLDSDRLQSRGPRMSDRSNYWDRDNFGSSSYDRSEGNYMGSGYDRSTRGSRGGDYGSMGSYDSRSSYSDGSYGQRQHHDPYARDTENTRIQHKDSDYNYDPNHSFDSRRKADIRGSHDRYKSWNRDSDRF